MWEFLASFSCNFVKNRFYRPNQIVTHCFQCRKIVNFFKTNSWDVGSHYNSCLSLSLFYLLSLWQCCNITWIVCWVCKLCSQASKIMIFKILCVQSFLSQKFQLKSTFSRQVFFQCTYLFSFINTGRCITFFLSYCPLIITALPHQDASHLGPHTINACAPP